MYIYIYSQEWEIDQLLQFCRCNFICLIFAVVFTPKYWPTFDQNMSRRLNYTLKWRGGEAAPPIYFIFTPSRRGIFWSNILL